MDLLAQVLPFAGKIGMADWNGQVLWDARHHCLVDDLIRLLRNQFGSFNEEQRYCSELTARRHRPSEPLQTVYKDVQ